MWVRDNGIKCSKFKIGKVMLLCMSAFVLVAGMPMKSRAATVDFNSKMIELQTKFPHDKYWNHVGMTTDNSDGYTDKPCELHKTNGIHINGTDGCTCNHFAGGGHLSATQCMGFANKLASEIFGETTWTTVGNPNATAKAGIKAGDIVRIGGTHTVFVTATDGANITVAEANYPNNCKINWGRKIALATTTITYYEHAGNYDTVLGDGVVTPPEQSTTEEPSFTGWKTTEDGAHAYYVKEGVIQKETWLTLSKKKYYVDASGYKVTGLQAIGKQTYFFNDDGVLQKKKWVTVDGATYYVGNSGYVLKKQWLYKGNVLVYVTGDGSMARNELVKIGTNTYYFNKKGKRSSGFKKCQGKYYYCNSYGIVQKKKWITQKGKKYYLQKSGVRAQSQLLKIGKQKYYFDSKGRMVKNKEVTYKDKIYKADAYGRCKFVRDIEDDEEDSE